MNRCIFVGRLTRDPEVSFFQRKPRCRLPDLLWRWTGYQKREGEPEADFLTVWHSIGKQSLWNSIGTWYACGGKRKNAE